MEIVIRSFTMADFEAVRQLWQTCNIQLGPQDSQEEIQKKLKRDSDLFLVAEVNNIISGAIIGAWDGRNGWIYNNAVDPRSRRLGLGSRLLSELERRLKAKGASRIRLLVGLGNFDAQYFYEDSGFNMDEERIVMSKLLKDNKGRGQSV